MSKNQYLGLIVLLVFVGALAFYWYEWRPTKIKQQCSAEARFDKRAIETTSDTLRQHFIDSYYEDCLMRFGLK